MPAGGLVETTIEPRMIESGTILVTGHLGYVGSHTAAAAIRAGFAVRGLDIGLYAVPDELPIPDVTHIAKDLRDVERADLEGVDAVIHLAALSSDPLCALLPEAARAINERASLRLAELARDAGVRRFVFVSTLGVFGDTGDGWSDESSPVSPRTVYRETKAAVEEGLRALAEPGFEPRIVRLPTLYGDSPRLRRDLVVNIFAHRASQGLALHVDGDGSQWRPLAHVADAARALVRVATATNGVAPGSVLHLCEAEQNYRVRDIAALVAEAFPGTEVTFSSEPPPTPGNYRVRSCCFDHWLAGFVREHTPETGIRELRQRFIERPLTAQQEAAGARVAWLRAALGEGRFSPMLRSLG